MGRVITQVRVGGVSDACPAPNLLGLLVAGPISVLAGSQQPARAVQSGLPVAPQAPMAHDTDSEPSETSPSTKIDDLYRLIDEMEVAMLTTRAADGSLVSRPMQTQQAEPNQGLWFMTSTDTHKIADLRARPEVNLAYYNSRNREWVSVSGTVHLSQDRERIHQLYHKDWKAWLGDEGPGRDGGPDDDRIVLLDVEMHAATYMKLDQPRAVAMFRVAKAAVTGTPPKVGDLQHIELAEERLLSD
jgi:general stress protein 26